MNLQKIIDGLRDMRDEFMIRGENEVEVKKLNEIIETLESIKDNLEALLNKVDKD